MDRRRLILRYGWAGTAMLMLSAGCVYFRGPSPPTAASTYATPPASAVAAATPAEMAAIMTEVQQLGAVDPAAQNALLEDLKKTDPSLWPQLVQTFRASVAFHKQAEERERLAALKSGQTPQTEMVRQAGVVQQIDTAQPAGLMDRYAMAGNVPQALPNSADGAVAPKAVPAEFVASYPNTQLPEIHLCGAEEHAPADWHSQLNAAIKSLEPIATSSDNTRSFSNPSDQTTLRMLYLAAGRCEDALRPPVGPATADQEFWNEELFGLATVLDEHRLPDPQQRVAQAAEHLRNAANKLGPSPPLVVHNPAFCTEVLSYGMFKPFPKYEFKPGQEVVLYAEVENFASQSTDKGFYTSLKSRYQIVDSRAVRVAEQQYAVTEEWCKNPRRDYFVRYFMYMPGRIPSGNYTLQLTIEDTLGKQVAQSSIPFAIAGAE
ncbi:MAG TPA: hypothetical protein VGJ04_00775 [Pirellulales bacterium]|jgi:hypothetical protein